MAIDISHDEATISRPEFQFSIRFLIVLSALVMVGLIVGHRVYQRYVVSQTPIVFDVLLPYDLPALESPEHPVVICFSYLLSSKQYHPAFDFPELRHFGHDFNIKFFLADHIDGGNGSFRYSSSRDASLDDQLFWDTEEEDFVNLNTMELNDFLNRIVQLQWDFDDQPFVLVIMPDSEQSFALYGGKPEHPKEMMKMIRDRMRRQ